MTLQPVLKKPDLHRYMPNLICKMLDTIELSIQQVAESVADWINTKRVF